jgi:hypothetical protein
MRGGKKIEEEIPHPLIQPTHSGFSPLRLLPRSVYLAGPLVAILIYALSLGNYFTGEDFIFIRFASTDKLFYEASQPLFYRPLPNLLWEMDYWLWGLQAWGYHLTNLALHITNVMLVGWLAHMLTGKRVVAAFAALLFAAHPLHVEPVMWLASRPDLVATAFFLSALIAGLRYFGKGGWPYYILSLLLFALGMFSKESAAGLPIVLFGIAVMIKKPFSMRSSLRFSLHFLPYIGIIAGYLAVRVAALGSFGGYDNGGRDVLYIAWNATFGLWLPLLFPINVDIISLPLGVGLAGLLMVFYLWLWLRGRLGRLFPYLAGIVLTYGSLLPALNTSPVTPNMTQSRILYLPSAGFCILFSLLIYTTYPHKKHKKAAESIKRKRGSKLWATIPVVVLVVLYCTGVLVALVPWFEAGGLVSDTFRLMKSQPIQEGDTIFYEGLPDSFRGAYLWRNGLAEATPLLLGASVEGVRRTEDLSIDYGRTGRVWFARFRLNQKSAALEPIFFYSVYPQGLGGNLDKNGATQGWNFASCDQQGWKWELQGEELECVNGQGLLYSTAQQKQTYEVTSPSLILPGKTFAVELSAYVFYDFQQPQVLADLYLLDANNREVLHQFFDIAVDGRFRSYYLPASVPPDSTGPYSAKIKINRTRTSIIWQQIRILNMDSKYPEHG